MLESIKLGSSGEAVVAWQYFLLGLGLYKGEVTGSFDEETKKATATFQSRHGLVSDGWAGRDTYGVAFSLGFDPDAAQSANVPSCPAGVAPLSVAQKHQLFGRILFEPSGNSRNPEAITIVNAWEEKNIVKVAIPQLAKKYEGSPTKKFYFHKKAAPQIQRLFQTWEDRGFAPLILTYDGGWVPRFVRGSRTTLSSHAWGTAFDINASWNGYGCRPAAVGEKGSVRELVDIAVDHGFFWGGWFPRKDGMHFEISKVL